MVVGRFYRDDKNKNIILIIAEDSLDSQNHSYGDLHEATCRWFVDQERFSLDSFIVRDATKKCNNRPTAEVEFVGEGIVLAKLQGYIK